MSIEAFIERVIEKIDGEFETAANTLLQAAKVSDNNRCTLFAGKIDGLKRAVDIIKEEKKLFVQFAESEEEVKNEQPLY